MPTRTKGVEHYELRNRKTEKKTKLIKLFDKLIYFGVIVGPLMNLPQMFKIWYYQSAAGVSIFSWFGFSVISTLWMVYGFLHKEKPIIFMNMGLIVVQVLIATGALIYG